MKLQCDLCREIVTADFAVAGDGIEVHCPACGKSFVATPTRREPPIVELARARAARRSPADDEPSQRCPKCDDLQPPAAACRSCGLLAARFADFARDRDAHVPPEVAAAWQRVNDAWNDDAVHDAFLRTVATALAFPWAALRYREALRLRPDDPRATERLARLARMVEATLIATSVRKADATPRPYKNLVTLLIALVVLIAVGVAYAVVATRPPDDGGEPGMTTPGVGTPARRTPKVRPRPRPAEAPAPGATPDATPSGTPR